jgi:hypothetical protein
MRLDSLTVVPTPSLSPPSFGGVVEESNDVTARDSGMGH